MFLCANLLIPLHNIISFKQPYQVSKLLAPFYRWGTKALGGGATCPRPKATRGVCGMSAQRLCFTTSSSGPACCWAPLPLQWPPAASFLSCIYSTSDMSLNISSLSFLLIPQTTKSARRCPIDKWRDRSLVGIGGSSEITHLVRNTTKTGTYVSLIPKAPHPGPLDRVHPPTPGNTIGLLLLLFCFNTPCSIDEFKWQVWLCITALLISLWIKRLVDFHLTSKESDYWITIEELLTIMFCNYGSC